MKHARHVVSDAFSADFRHGFSVVGYFARSRVKKLHNKFDNAAFSAARTADKRNLFAGRDIERHVAQRVLRRPFVSEIDVRKFKCARKSGQVFVVGFFLNFRFQNLVDTSAVYGDFRQKRKHHRKHHNAVHDKRDVLHDRDNIRPRNRRLSALHKLCADVQDKNRDKVKPQHDNRRKKPHIDVGFYDVFRHDERGFVGAVALAIFPVERADNAYTRQPFADNAVLFVDVFVALFPKRHNATHDEIQHRHDDRHEREHDKRKPRIGKKRQRASAKHQNGNTDDALHKHTRALFQKPDIVCASRDERARAPVIELVGIERVYLFENYFAQGL